MSARLIDRALRSFALAALAGLLTACIDGNDDGMSPPPPPPPPAGPVVTISGRITYDFVPHGATGGLDYSQTQARPARLVTVQFIAGASAPVTTRTDLNGDYSLSVPANRTGFIRALAQTMQGGTPGWTFRVVDNTDGNELYTLDGAELSSGEANSVRNLRAPSGWTGTNYGAARAAAPFAILDTVYTAAVYIAAADPTIVYPALDLHWSPENRSVFDANGDPDPATGEIGTSFYTVNQGLGLSGIYLLGEENLDSDEYDRHVIAHEFGHYLEHRFGRSENLGGPHGRGDRVDPRVAFSEGWATGFSGLALFDPVYIDAGGFRQMGATGFNIENSATSSGSRGWYSEQSVWELVYDLGDAATIEAHDNITYPFADIWTVFKGAATTTKSLPTIFPFWRALKLAHPADQIPLDQLTTFQRISPVADDYGTGETNLPIPATHPEDVLPVYTPITFGVPVNLCSTAEFTSGQTGAVNKLGSRRFLRFSSLIAGSVTVTVTATSIPPGEFADPDFLLHWNALVIPATGPPSAACQDNATGIGSPASCVETRIGIPVAVDDYVLEIYEWSNTNDNDATEPYPPIGRTCFDVMVTQP